MLLRLDLLGWTPRPIALLAAVFVGLMLATQPLRAEGIVLDAEQRTALAGLPALRGEEVVPDDFKDRIVVVTFFASWCPPCNPEFDHLQAVRNKYSKDQLKIVAVNIFESFSGLSDGKKLQAFLRLKNPSFITLGEGESIAKAFGDVKRIPSVFVFDSKGELAFDFIHGVGAKKTHVEEDELTEVIEGLLASG